MITVGYIRTANTPTSAVVSVLSIAYFGDAEIREVRAPASPRGHATAAKATALVLRTLNIDRPRSRLPSMTMSIANHEAPIAAAAPFTPQTQAPTPAAQSVNKPRQTCDTAILCSLPSLWLSPYERSISDSMNLLTATSHTVTVVVGSIGRAIPRKPAMDTARSPLPTASA
jgi:hypothetical protein